MPKSKNFSTKSLRNADLKPDTTVKFGMGRGTSVVVEVSGRQSLSIAVPTSILFFPQREVAQLMWWTAPAPGTEVP
jgi:hypothetical protein